MYFQELRRCRVNGQLFSPDYNSTDRGALIQAMFVMNDSNELHPYFGIVRFYFQICIKHKSDTGNLQNVILAYVTWMVFKTPEKDKFSNLYLVSDTFYQRDKIISVSVAVPWYVVRRNLHIMLPIYQRCN